MRITHMLAAAALAATMLPMTRVSLAAQDATPAPPASCEETTTAMSSGTPDAEAPHDMAGVNMGTPGAGVDHAAMGLDLMYIDMMIPHHASIIAMAQAAAPRLEDERLREIAATVIATQQPEIDELRALRQAIAGDPDPMPMDEAMMTAMEELMPGMSGTMEEMDFQMDAAAQVAAICAAGDADLAFIDLTISHHQMAIEASQAVVEQSESPELRGFAQRVIDAQERETDALTAIREELAGLGTPSASDEASAHAGDHHEASETAEALDGPQIRALTGEVIAQIERGEGAGFALPAERNGVPGPRHVLDLAAELGLSGEQQSEVQAIHDAMLADAIPAGARYLAAQRALETDFRAGAIDADILPERVAEVRRREADLATIHLAAHLQTAALLTADQIEVYVELRQGS